MTEKKETTKGTSEKNKTKVRKVVGEVIEVTRGMRRVVRRR